MHSAEEPTDTERHQRHRRLCLDLVRAIAPERTLTVERGHSDRRAAREHGGRDGMGNRAAEIAADRTPPLYKKRALAHSRRKKTSLTERIPVSAATRRKLKGRGERVFGRLRRLIELPL